MCRIDDHQTPKSTFGHTNDSAAAGINAIVYFRSTLSKCLKINVFNLQLLKLKQYIWIINREQPVDSGLENQRNQRTQGAGCCKPRFAS